MIIKLKMLKGACIYVAGKEWYISDAEAKNAFYEITHFIDKKAAEAQARQKKREEDEQE